MTANQGAILHLSITDREKVNLAAEIRLIAEKGMEIESVTKRPFPAYTPEDFQRVQAEIASDPKQLKDLLRRPLNELQQEVAAAKGIVHTSSPAPTQQSRIY